MKRTRHLVGVVSMVLALGAGRAFAAACATDTYDHYVGTTCTIGNLTFSLFTFASSAGGSGIVIPASAITVTPITTPGEVGFQFSGPWAVRDNGGSSSFEDVLLAYTVSAASAVITDFGLVFDGSITGTGSSSATEPACLDHVLIGCPTGSSIQLQVTNPPPAPKQFALGLGPAQSIAMSKDINVTSGTSGSAMISQVINTFSQGCVKAIGPLSLAPGVLNAVYPPVTFTLTAGSAPIAFLQSGPLPNGMGFNNGVLSGTPTQSGSFPITVTASDNAGCTGSQSYTLIVAASAAANACTATTYDHYIGATCTINNLTFSNFGYTSSAAPTGIPIPPSAISVTPITTPGDEGFAFSGGWTASAGNAAAMDSLLSYTVSAPAQTISDIHLSSNGSFTGTGLTGVTEAYCLGAPMENCLFGTLGQIKATNPPSAPQLSALGLGPVQSVAVSKDITATSGANGTATISQVINTFSQGCVKAIGPLSLAPGVLNAVYPPVTFALTAGSAPIAFLQSGSLPNGMGFNSGVLSGTPTQLGSFPITVTASDNAGCTGSQSYTLIVAASAAANTCTATTYDHYIGATCTINNLTFSNFGYASSAAPTGAPIPASAISVAPITTPGDEGFTFGGGWTPTPSAGNSTTLDSLLSYTVSAPSAVISGIGLNFNGSFTGTGLTGVTEAYCLGAPIENCLFGILGQIQVTNPPSAPQQSALGLGPVQSVAVSKDIAATSGANGTASITQVTNTFLHCALPLTPATLPTGTAGTPYPTVTFGLTGGATPIAFTVIGALPLGMSPAGGQLSGTPLQTGSFPISVMGVDNTGCVGVTVYTLTIDCQAITVTPPGPAPATVGVPFVQTFSQTGAIGGATFAITAGTIPGLSLSSGGVLSGIPTTPGTFPITVTVTDGNGCTGSTPYTLILTEAIPALSRSGLLALAVLLGLAAVLLLRRGVVRG